VPQLVVTGLDNVETRHSVQRLWPETLIDMAAGGFTSQVLVKNNRDPGLCLVSALEMRERDLTYSERLSGATGLAIDRILEAPTEPITKKDVAGAPLEMQAELERARQAGELICGRIRYHNLSRESNGPYFDPAVPFVTSFSGVVGAAETMKWLMGRRHSHSLHLQYSFQSGRIRAFQMNCLPDCECKKHSENRNRLRSSA